MVGAGFQRNSMDPTPTLPTHESVDVESSIASLVSNTVVRRDQIMPAEIAARQPAFSPDLFDDAAAIGDSRTTGKLVIQATITSAMELARDEFCSTTATTHDQNDIADVVYGIIRSA